MQQNNVERTVIDKSNLKHFLTVAAHRFRDNVETLLEPDDPAISLPAAKQLAIAYNDYFRQVCEMVEAIDNADRVELITEPKEYPICRTCGMEITVGVVHRDIEGRTYCSLVCRRTAPRKEGGEHNG